MAAPAAEDAKTKHQRSRAGCLTCRKRKVKCDEQRPMCENCDYGARECVWPVVDGPRKRRRRCRNVDPGLEQMAAFQRPATAAARPAMRPFEFDGPLIAPKMRVDMMMDPSVHGGRPMLMCRSFLLPYFPTIDQRLVIRYYLSTAADNLLAFQSPNQPFNPWITVHAPLAFRHLPGALPAADALRTAMLAVGTVRMRYATSPNDYEGAGRVAAAARAKVAFAVNQTLLFPSGATRPTSKEEIELILCAMLSVTLASSLAADDAWHSQQSAAIALVEQLGGAQKLLQASDHSQLSPTRFVLEQLAIRDVFGCMTTGTAPSILQSAYTPWFFEIESWSRAGLEWETVERGFGVSRGMIDLIARTCALISSVRESGYKIDEHDPHTAGAAAPTPLAHGAADFALRLPDRFAHGALAARIAVPNAAVPPPSTPPSPASSQSSLSVDAEAQRVELEITANALMAELRIWDQASNFTPFHPRTQYGNHCYRHAMRIWLLRNVFGLREDDERVQGAVKAIVELGKELIAMYGNINWMTWPILIAGFHLQQGDPARASISELLGNFGPHACYDNVAAVRMITEFWKLRDEQQSHDVDHWQVSSRLKRRPFLD